MKRVHHVRRLLGTLAGRGLPYADRPRTGHTASRHHVTGQGRCPWPVRRTQRRQVQVMLAGDVSLFVYVPVKPTVTDEPGAIVPS